MLNAIFMNWLTLSLFVAFMGFCFCDGFKLHILRKLIWFSGFLLLSFYSLNKKGSFDLLIILPPALLLAILVCSYEKFKQKQITK